MIKSLVKHYTKHNLPEVRGPITIVSGLLYPLQAQGHWDLNCAKWNLSVWSSMPFAFTAFSLYLVICLNNSGNSQKILFVVAFLLGEIDRLKLTAKVTLSCFSIGKYLINSRRVQYGSEQV